MQQRRCSARHSRRRAIALRRATAILSIVAARATVVFAGNPIVTYIGPNGGNWNTPGNWSGSFVPLGNGTDVFVTSTFAVAGAVSFDGNYTSSINGIGPLLVSSGSTNPLSLNLTLAAHNLFSINETFAAGSPGGCIQTTSTNSVGSNLYLGQFAGGLGTYSLSGSGNLSVGNSEYIGDAGPASFTQSGGTHTVNGTGNNGLYLGNQAGSSGSYLLSGGSLTVASNEDIGVGAAGNFTQSGGTNSVLSFYLGISGASATGTYLFSGGTLSIVGGSTFSGENVGYGSAGALIQHGGSNIVGSTAQPVNLTIGTSLGSTGTYTMDAGSATPTLSVSGNEYVGNGGSGSLTQTAGVHSVGGSLSVGHLAGSSGSVSLGGTAQLTVAGSETVGDAAFGTFNQSGGTHAITGSLNVANGANSGSYSLSGGQLIVGTENLGSAASGGATFTQSGGTHTINGQLHLAAAATSLAGYNLTGASAVLIDHGAQIGDAGSGGFQQQNGTHIVHGNLTVSTGGTSSGQYILDAGVLTVDGNEQISGAAFGNFVQTGGTHTVGGSLTLGSPTIVGAYAMNGGALSITGALSLGTAGVSAGTFSLTNGVVTVGGATSLSTGSFIIVNGGGTLNVTTVTVPSSSNFQWFGPGTVNFVNGYTIDSHFIKYTLTTGQNLNTGGPATNNNTFVLGGGVIGGSGNYTNNGTFYLAGGTIGGSGAFTNNALLDVQLSSQINAAGGLINTGQLTLEPGAGVTLTLGTPLTNHGIVTLGSGSKIAGSFTLTNASDGVIDPNGELAVPVVNNGIIQVLAGQTLTTSGSMTNNASVRVNATGAINNTSQFASIGSIHSDGNFTNSGTASLNGTQFWGIGTAFNNTGSATLLTDAGPAGALLTINDAAGTVTFSASQHLAGLSITSSGQAVVSLAASALSPNVINAGALAFAGSGKINLGNNELIASVAASTVRAELIANTIFTTHVGTNTALGYVDIGGGQTEVRYTLRGDTNLDSSVNVGDLGALATLYGLTAGGTWSQGDSNYDGKVDVADLGALATVYGTSLAAGSADAVASPSDVLNNTAASVPEPGALIIFSFVGVAAASRRGKRIRANVILGDPG